MTIVLFAFFLLCLTGIRLRFCNEAYISRDTTIQINGIFVFLVLLSHFISTLNSSFPYSEFYMEFREFMKQLVVTTFLFYSGYGVMISIRKKGLDYVNKLPTKMIELIINFSVAIVLFAILGWVLDKDYSFGRIIASCIGWKSIGNSNWYLFDILLLYGLSFVAYIVTKGKQRRFLGMMLGLSLMAMLFLAEYQNGTRWYNTFLCYWVGLTYGAYKERFDQWLLHKPWQAPIGLLIFGMCFLIFHYFRGNILFYILHAICFVLCVNVASMFLHFHSPMLLWLGKHIFSIYILQRIPMIVGKAIGLHEEYTIIYFFGTLVVCFLMAEVFNRCTKIIVKRLVY